MSLLESLSMQQGYLKAGFQGFQASGKTHTAMLLAVAVRRMFNLAGPIAMFDTETGSAYIGPRIKQATGKDLVGVRSRSLDKLLALGEECVKAGVSVLVVDSMTHIWREVCESYLDQINERLERYNRPRRWNLEFQDWAPIKAKFAQWTDFYLNSPLHVVIAGRAGYTYDFQEKEEGGKKELVKTGTKMKTEGEFGFEPSLLVEMEQAKEGDVVYNVATVLKDRYDVINGQEFRFGGVRRSFEEQLAAVVDAFGPHLDLLAGGTHVPVDTQSRTDLGVDEDGDDQWAREKKQRTILCEEIQGEMVRAYPGLTAGEKAAKADLLEKAFGTRSWTRVESMKSTQLKTGLGIVRQLIGQIPGAKTGPAAPLDDQPDAKVAEQAAAAKKLEPAGVTVPHTDPAAQQVIDRREQARAIIESVQGKPATVAEPPAPAPESNKPAEDTQVKPVGPEDEYMEWVESLASACTQDAMHPDEFHRGLKSYLTDEGLATEPWKISAQQKQVAQNAAKNRMGWWDTRPAKGTTKRK